MLLAGDIGGTKTSLALFSPEVGPHAPLTEATFPSDDYPNLEAIVREFMGQANQPVERAYFGVAGPVVNGRATITNLPWVIEEAHVAETFGLTSVHLLNDMEAIANAIPYLIPEDILTLNAGQPVAQGAIGIIAPGTGLGEGYMTWDGTGYRAHPSEGGHTNFGPTNALELDLLRYLQERFGPHVSYERLCSGIGLPNIYDFLKDSGREQEPTWLAERLAQVDDPTPVIVTAALDTANSCEICVNTLKIFVTILGSEAGNLALKVLATGGVYLGGGIPPRILAALRDKSFLAAFQNKGRFAQLMAQVPVHVILNRKVGLIGAACYGFYRST
jgi:glucokinase